jgi:hypothetical protein
MASVRICLPSTTIALPNVAVPFPSATPGGPAPTPDGCQYRFTHGIHPGLDYFTEPRVVEVLALCDGVIIQGASAGGGSALPNAGAGLSLRCFANDPNDTDGDGDRNLSNIVVVYNHLNLNRGVDRHSYQIVQNGQVIGETTGYTTTSGINVQAHLDLQIYVGRDFGLPTAVLINPLLMYESGLEARHTAMPYPSGYDRWSLHGYLRGNNAHFWTNPQNGEFISNITDYLAVVYPSGSQYGGPNCTNVPAHQTTYPATCVISGDDAITQTPTP